MLGILKLRNPIQRYAWGSRTAIPELLGETAPSPGPQAELWMGAHPQAPSEAFVGGRWVSLRELIRDAPGDLLGARVAARWGAELPFLLKVLAAAEPLSIQAHPDRAQARDGFRREDGLGIPRGAPHRNYRDPNHKPELLYALTPFRALRGFRPPAEILELVERAGLPELLPECRELRGGDESRALERFFGAYMSLEPGRIERLLSSAVRRTGELAGADAAFRWVRELADRHPGDRGALAPLMLNVLELEPGEAIFTGAGVLHAYLGGVGVELMASSDNVLRGGLTSKHVDVPELLRILRFERSDSGVLAPAVTAAGLRFEPPAEELALEVIEVTGERGCESRGGGSAAILLCGAGEGVIEDSAAVAFRRGDSFLIPAAVEGYRITGSARLFRASVPAQRPGI